MKNDEKWDGKLNHFICFWLRYVVFMSSAWKNVGMTCNRCDGLNVIWRKTQMTPYVSFYFDVTKRLGLAREQNGETGPTVSRWCYLKRRVKPRNSGCALFVVAYFQHATSIIQSTVYTLFNTQSLHGGHVRNVADMCNSYQFCQSEWNTSGSEAI